MVQSATTHPLHEGRGCRRAASSEGSPQPLALNPKVIIAITAIIAITVITVRIVRIVVNIFIMIINIIVNPHPP